MGLIKNVARGHLMRDMKRTLKTADTMDSGHLINRIAAYHDYHEHGEKTGDAELALRATAAIAAADMVLRFRGVEYKLVDKRDSTNP